jgi:hypothetical protein
LKVVHAMMKQYAKDAKIIGSHPTDGVITKDQLILRADRDIAKGNYKTIAQIRKESDHWK